MWRGILRRIFLVIYIENLGYKKGYELARLEKRIFELEMRIHQKILDKMDAKNKVMKDLCIAHNIPIPDEDEMTE